MITELRTIVDSANQKFDLLYPFSVVVSFQENGVIVTMHSRLGIELRVWYRNELDCYETIKYHGSVFSIGPQTVTVCQELISNVFSLVQKEMEKHS